VWEAVARLASADANPGKKGGKGTGPAAEDED